MSLSTLRNALASLLEPWVFIFWGISHAPPLILTLLRRRHFSTLLSPSSFHDALFGSFWSSVGPSIKATAEPRVTALLEGRVRRGAVHDASLAPGVRGVVVEVGAGSGMWADVLARFRYISSILGVEPNLASAAALRERVAQVGLGDVYTVLPVGIEDVDVEPESVDCIVSVLCLCSIPEPERNIRRLYGLLKPGGTWFVYEHVKATRGGPLMSLYQRFVSFFWMIPFGSCHLCRDTGRYLREAGSWTDFDLAQPPDEASLAMCPHIIGTATK